MATVEAVKAASPVVVWCDGTTTAVWKRGSNKTWERAMSATSSSGEADSSSSMCGPVGSR